MRTFRSVAAMTAAVALFALTPAIALAQPGMPPSGGSYHGASPPSYGAPFHPRRGLTLGFGFGIGDMSADSGPIECFDCVYNPLAAGFDFHIGGMLNPRLALLFELWGTVKTLDSYGSASLIQSMAMIAAQYWVAPRLWIKGGLGAAQLTFIYDDGYYVDQNPIDNGVGVMGAVGYEVLIAPHFALDVQLRVGTGAYEGIGERIHVATLGAGFNWY